MCISSQFRSSTVELVFDGKAGMIYKSTLPFFSLRHFIPTGNRGIRKNVTVVASGGNRMLSSCFLSEQRSHAKSQKGRPESWLCGKLARNKGYRSNTHLFTTRLVSSHPRVSAQTLQILSFCAVHHRNPHLWISCVLHSTSLLCSL